jgi:hypothetical protein
MIANKDRSGWFGASDTSYIVGNWETATFKKWWLEKLGLRQNSISTKAMKCGNAFEHKILDIIDCRKDHQIIIPELLLRVNYDGDNDATIYEVKTFKAEKTFKVTKAYWRQAQVEMFAMGTSELYIVAYPLGAEEYRNYFMPVDKGKIQYHKIEYDSDFIEHEYLPKLKFLTACLKARKMPSDFENIQKDGD